MGKKSKLIILTKEDLNSKRKKFEEVLNKNPEEKKHLMEKQEIMKKAKEKHMRKKEVTK